jgi:hypothetical protein
MRSFALDSVVVLKRIIAPAFMILLRVESIPVTIMSVFVCAHHVVKGVW